MGVLADLWLWFTDVGNTIVNAIVDGSTWLRDRIREVRAAAVTVIAGAMQNPWGAIFAITGMVLVQITLQSLYDAIKKTQEFQRIVTFLIGIGQLISTVAQWAQLDLMITLIRLGAIVNDGFYAQLSRIYMSLGDLAVELEVDFNFITSFLEVNRSILHATYSIIPLGEIKAEADYADGLAVFLRGITSKLGDYAKDPSKIFTDIQAAIIYGRASKAQEEIGKVWAAIDKTALWVSTSGKTLMDEVDTLNGILGGMPQEIQDAIKPWFDPIKKQIDDFETLTWGPFWQDYNDASAEITATFDRHGVKIKALEDALKSPIDILRAILSWPPERLNPAIVDLDELTSKGIREVLKASDTGIPVIAGAMMEVALLPLPVFVAPEPVTFHFEEIPPGYGGGALTAPGWYVGEGGGDPYPPGRMSPDGRGWFVGE